MVEPKLLPREVPDGRRLRKDREDARRSKTHSKTAWFAAAKLGARLAITQEFRSNTPKIGKAGFVGTSAGCAHFPSRATFAGYTDARRPSETRSQRCQSLVALNKRSFKRLCLHSNNGIQHVQCKTRWRRRRRLQSHFVIGRCSVEIGVDHNEEVGRAIALVFRIVAVSLSRFLHDRHTRLADELDRTFIEAHDWSLRITRLGVEIEEILHPGDIFAIDSGDAPHLLLPGFRSLSSSLRRMVSRETL